MKDPKNIESKKPRSAKYQKYKGQKQKLNKAQPKEMSSQ